MKKLTALLLVFAMLFCLCACGTKAGTGDSQSKTQEYEDIEEAQDETEISFDTVTGLLRNIANVWISVDYDDTYIQDTSITLFAFSTTDKVAVLEADVDFYEDLVYARNFISIADYYSLDSAEEQMYLVDCSDCDICTFTQDGDRVTLIDEDGDVFYEFTYVYAPAQNTQQISLLGAGEDEGLNYYCEPYLYQNSSSSYFYGNWNMLEMYCYEGDYSEHKCLIHFGENLFYTCTGDWEDYDMWSYIDGRLEASGLTKSNDEQNVIMLSNSCFICFYERNSNITEVQIYKSA